MNTGDIVLIGSPMFVDQYRLAKIVSQTDKTVMVAYWHCQIKNWHAEINRRNKDNILKVIGPDEDYSSEQIQRAFDRIASANAEREERIRKARVAHNRAMTDFVIK